MVKNASPTVKRPGKTNKYLQRGDDYIHRMQSSARVSVEHNVVVRVGDEAFIEALKRGDAVAKGNRIVHRDGSACSCRPAKAWIRDTAPTFVRNA